MSDDIFFAPLRVPITDVRTGLMNREWYLFFQALFLRVGGSNAPDFSEIVQQLLAVQVAQDGAAQGATFVPLASFEDLLGELRATRDQVTEFAKRLDDIQQGTLL